MRTLHWFHLVRMGDAVAPLSHDCLRDFGVRARLTLDQSTPANPTVSCFSVQVTGKPPDGSDFDAVHRAIEPTVGANPARRSAPAFAPAKSPAPRSTKAAHTLCPSRARALRDAHNGFTNNRSWLPCISCVPRGVRLIIGAYVLCSFAADICWFRPGPASQ